MTPSTNRAKTIFLDIDGSILAHLKTMTHILAEKPQILPGVIEKFNEWDGKGYKIILTTGRKESARAHTEEQLRSFGLFWDHLIMGLGGVQRVLINDIKPYDPDKPTAVAINLIRDKGLEGIDI